MTPRLSAESESLDECLVSLGIGPLQIAQQPTTLTDELHQTSSGVVVMLVLTQMLGQNIDAFGEQSDLYFGRAGVAFMLAKLFDDRCLLRFV